MGRFRSRKPAVAWLPHVTHNEQLPIQGWWASTFTIDKDPTVMRTQIFALVPDYPAEAVRLAGALPTLADFEASAYRLRRLVGKVNVYIEQKVSDPQETRPFEILVGGGFIVLKCEEDTGAPLVTTANHYSPLANDSTGDPWIWRRTWLLTNSFAIPGGQSTDLPRSNAEYGSIADGPHLDQRTARRVAREERLFFVLSAISTFGGAATNDGTGRFILDYRVLASPIKVMGNRRNASR